MLAPPSPCNLGLALASGFWGSLVKQAGSFFYLSTSCPLCSLVWALVSPAEQRSEAGRVSQSAARQTVDWARGWRKWASFPYAIDTGGLPVDCEAMLVENMWREGTIGYTDSSEALGKPRRPPHRRLAEGSGMVTFGVACLLQQREMHCHWSSRGISITFQPNEGETVSHPGHGLRFLLDRVDGFSGFCVRQSLVWGRTGGSSLVSALFTGRPQERSTVRWCSDLPEIGLHEPRMKMSIIPQDPVLFTDACCRKKPGPFLRTDDDDDLWKALESWYPINAPQKLRRCSSLTLYSQSLGAAKSVVEGTHR
ncbi:multidrug resistance-associated protein 4-like isoform X1 [Lates japonicus]|uniref:Multidrug resistance-associated protein 4-like isoform X1 n=1 Tax=Lates japonicus TaxID=270547 RepID=A0AAD3M7X8_LATJO|nr:multidrug resistance-associated protein 4-like isoform X1 [Lates japonicus]